MLGNFGRRRGGVHSIDAEAHAAHAIGHATHAVGHAARTIGGVGHEIKLGSLGLDRRFLGDASAGGRRGGERTVAGDGLQCSGEREGLAFREELALAIEPLDVCNGEGVKRLRWRRGKADVRGFSKNARKANWAACAAMLTKRRA